MRYIPEERKLLAEGDYDFRVEGAKERTSRNGTDMIEVKLIVTDGRGNKTVVFDNLLSWNLPEFQAAIGDQVAYGQEIEVNAYDLVGATGRCHIIIDQYQGNERNKVGKYLPATVLTGSKPTVNEFGEPDEVPF
jgi:hypothetical protein